jgi:hypothetical protein
MHASSERMNTTHIAYNRLILLKNGKALEMLKKGYLSSSCNWPIWSELLAAAKQTNELQQSRTDAVNSVESQWHYMLI